MFQKLDMQKIAALDRLELFFMGNRISPYERMFSSKPSNNLAYELWVQDLKKTNDMKVDTLFEQVSPDRVTLLNDIYTTLNLDIETQDKPTFEAIFRAALLMYDCDNLNKDELEKFRSLIQMQRDVLLSVKRDSEEPETYAFAYDLTQAYRPKRKIADESTQLIMPFSRSLLAIVATLDIGFIAAVVQYKMSMVLLIAATTMAVATALMLLFMLYLNIQPCFKPDVEHSLVQELGEARASLNPSL